MATMNKGRSQGAAREPIHEVKAEFFRTLGHPARVRVIGLLRDGEKTVGQIQSELGIDSSGASQHLAALRRAGILESRKEGTSVYYGVRDPRIFQMMESARQVIGSHLEEAHALLGELGEEGAPREGATTGLRSRQA
ncbi:MAG TPA: metalloregulator ArsR/SmtB family transcription factor [Solirubrobacterales bacterium]|nr:metalloregulator ArsR/SmtB family transcription factor [Solirubrobacterales bacterium]